MSTDVRLLLENLDGSGSEAEWSAVMELRKHPDFPIWLLEHYNAARSWQTRASCVYHAIRYATQSHEAFQLGMVATQDKSKVVRYRAAMLLAVAQEERALGALSVMQASFGNTAEDAIAAATAIQKRNPDLFVDRDGSGNITLQIA